MALSSELKTVIKIAKKASEIIMSYRNKELGARIKGGDEADFVTLADEEADDYIREALGTAFPKDIILSEENDKRPKDYSDRVWMVDPLDGTNEFVSGGDSFSVLIGLCIDGTPTLGVVLVPVTGQLYWAQSGHGAYTTYEGKARRLHTSQVKRIADATNILIKNPREVRPSEEHLKRMKTSGTLYTSTFGERVGQVIEKQADFFVNTNMRASKWDSCAIQVILEEAGGKLTDVWGDPLDYKQKALNWPRSFVATNGTIHSEVVEFLKPIRHLFKK